MEVSKNDSRFDGGFTLIEVALAIAILGLGLATLTAATTRLVDNTWYEIQRQRASMAAEYVLESLLHDSITNAKDNQLSSSSGLLTSKLESTGYFDDVDGLAPSRKEFEEWSYELKVTPMSLPLAESQFQQISLRISWGIRDIESYSLEVLKKEKNSSLTNQPNIPNQPSG